MTVPEMKKVDGVTKILEFLDTIFQRDSLVEAYESYTEFDRFKRSPNENIDLYVAEFERLYTVMKKFKMELSDAVLAFKLLDFSGLEQQNRQLVLTGVDYKKEGEMYAQMGTSLKKFFGKQSTSAEESTKSAIKLEPEGANALETDGYGYYESDDHPSCYDETEDVYYGNNQRRNWRGRGSYRNFSNFQQRPPQH